MEVYYNIINVGCVVEMEIYHERMIWNWEFCILELLNFKELHVVIDCGMPLEKRWNDQ